MPTPHFPAAQRTFSLTAAVIGGVALLALAGCAQPLDVNVDEKDSTGRPVVVAARVRWGVTLDGRLEESVWRRAPGYAMFVPGKGTADGRPPGESGVVKLAWDRQYLYVGVEFVDTDVVNSAMTDQLDHYALGDVAEVFLRCEGRAEYLELYATPSGFKSCFWFEKKGSEKLGDPGCGLRVAAEIHGTLNESMDPDRGWSAEIAIPWSDLTVHGAPLATKVGVTWRILVGRYNHSMVRAGGRAELSSCPGLSRDNYHLLEEHAVLRLER